MTARVRIALAATAAATAALLPVDPPLRLAAGLLIAGFAAALPLPKPPPPPPPAPPPPPDVVDHLPDQGFVLLGPDGRVLRWSRGAERLSGHPAATMLGAPLGNIFPAAFAERATQLVRSAQGASAREGGESGGGAQGSITRDEVYLDRPGGASWWAALEVRRAGEGVVVTFRDVTSERDEREVQAWRREVLEQARRMEAATQRRGELLSGITHDLRTPVTTILGYAEMLQQGRLGPLSPLHRTCVADIHQAARHLSRLVDDTLDLARLEAGRLEIRPAVFALAPALEEARLLAGEDGSRVRIDVDDALGDARLDPDRFRQVVLNFLSNALKFSPPGSPVLVRAKPAAGEGWFRIEVEDAGPGIDAADVPRLFTEYRRLERAGERRTPGTGLGLALTRRLVELQGGRVGVRPAPTGGSVFFAVFPRRPRNTTGPRPATLRHDEPVLMLVEPSAERVGPLIAALSAAGVRPRVAESGEAALELGAAGQFDAVVVPLFLPDMTGLDVLRTLRTELLLGDAAVLVATPDGKLHDAAELAVFAVLTAPLEAPAILDALRRCGLRLPR